MNEKTLNEMASEMVGDGKSPNMFFVTNAKGDTITVTIDFNTAYAHWQQLAQTSPRHECALEDRKHGVLASVEPEEDGSEKLITIDDSRMFKDIRPNY